MLIRKIQAEKESLAARICYHLVALDIGSAIVSNDMSNRRREAKQYQHAKDDGNLGKYMVGVCD